jgi:hypothetical protein
VGVVDVNVVVLPAGRLFNKRLVDARAVLLHIILLLLIRMCGEISKSFESVCMSKVSWISEGWFHSCACTRPGVGGWVQGMHDTHACTPCVTAGCLRVPRSSSSADDEDFGLSEPPLQPHARYVRVVHALHTHTHTHTHTPSSAELRCESQLSRTTPRCYLPEQPRQNHTFVKITK